jgi:hypothetical protein
MGAVRPALVPGSTSLQSPGIDDVEAANLIGMTTRPGQVQHPTAPVSWKERCQHPEEPAPDRPFLQARNLSPYSHKAPGGGASWLLTCAITQGVCESLTPARGLTCFKSKA